MEYMRGVFDFLRSLVDVLKSVNVPPFDFSFWDFGVATFMMCSGIAFLRFFLWVKSDNSEGGNDGLSY